MSRVRVATVLFSSFFAAFIALLLPQVTQAAVNDFRITNYTIDYTLSRSADNDNRSVLKTVETITVDFPETDQNHGIERAIPKSYDGHSVGLVVDSVVDQSGVSLNYSTYDSNGNRVLRIGDANTYVHGSKTYIITYTQQDVTKFFSDTKDDEFYWDTNGTQWNVPIDNLSVTLRMDGSIAGRLNGQATCYQGIAGSSNQCTLVRADNVYQAQVANLGSGQNVTIAVGFQPGTFGAYEMSILEKAMQVLVVVWIIGALIAIVVMVWLSIKWNNWSRRKSEVGTIVPEYTPPKDVSVTTSASIISGSTKTFAAQLIDFAVRHYVKIYEIDKKWIFGSKDYEIEIVRDITDLHPEEQEILRDIFSDSVSVRSRAEVDFLENGNLSATERLKELMVSEYGADGNGPSVPVGSRLKMSSLKNNRSVYMNTVDNDTKLKELIRGQYGLRAKDPVKAAWFKRTGWVLLASSVLLLNPVIFVAAIGAFIAGATLYPFTDKGLELYRYLEGLKLYIKVAEVERLKMLQSPEGAEKVGTIDPNDPKQLVKLYEKTLPYAILFGQEDEWNKQIGKYYESMGAQPDWYNGNTAFNAAAFGTAMNSFTTTSSYTAASSSSSGGSSGGGSSGGGGGGGGGGGW